MKRKPLIALSLCAGLTLMAAAHDLFLKFDSKPHLSAKLTVCRVEIAAIFLTFAVKSLLYQALSHNPSLALRLPSFSPEERTKR
jgi:hypothetical protein